MYHIDYIFHYVFPKQSRPLKRIEIVAFYRIAVFVLVIVSFFEVFGDILFF